MLKRIGSQQQAQERSGKRSGNRMRSRIGPGRSPRCQAIPGKSGKIRSIKTGKAAMGTEARGRRIGRRSGRSLKKRQIGAAKESKSGQASGTMIGKRRRQAMTTEVKIGATPVGVVQARVFQVAAGQIATQLLHGRGRRRPSPSVRSDGMPVRAIKGMCVTDDRLGVMSRGAMTTEATTAIRGTMLLEIAVASRTGTGPEIAPVRHHVDTMMKSQGET
mmetsp:Transcript_5814/g.10453  ORF Transcript_5814/g.10453 Transcript_5814/m.10453 type:complete len:218 (-) Transcript_5814:256-909(-)